MGHDYIQIDNSQARSIEKYLQEDSFSFLSFIVNCVSGTFLGLLSLVNILFYGLCNLVFKCFKIIDLVFKIIGSFMSFLRSLLQFNYHLVTQGFTILGEILSTLVLNFQVGCTSLVGLVISFVHSIINLPFSIATITWYYAGFLRENCHKLILVTYKLYQRCFDNIASCANVITNVIAWCVTRSVEGVNKIINLLSSIATITWLLLGSIFELCQNVNHILLGILDLSYRIFQHSANFIRGSVLDSASFFFDAIKTLAVPSSWLILFIPTCLLVIYLVRESHTIRRLKALVVKLFQTVCSYVHGERDARNTIRRLKALVVQLYRTVRSCVNREQDARNVQAAQRIDGPDQNRQNNLQNDNTLQRRNNLPHDPILNGQNDLQRGNNEERENVVQRRGNQNINDAVPPPNVPQDDERHLCIVCQDNDKTTVLLPCKHLCLCHDCAVTLNRGCRRCPLCRQQIQDILNVYL